MQRCDASDADLILDNFGWKFQDLSEALNTHYKVTTPQDASWPHAHATLHRWEVTAPQDVSAGAPPVPRRRTVTHHSALFPRPPWHDQGGV